MSIVSVNPSTIPTIDGWRGVNARSWRSEAELKAMVIADCKQAGIPVTVRFGRGGYLTSMTVTIKIKRDEIATTDEHDISCLTSRGCSMSDHLLRQCLTADGYRKYQRVKAIVDSYNRDESDIMTDYFDRDIYDHYTFKIMD